MNEEQTLIEEFMRLQGLMQKYFFLKRKEQGPFGNPHRGQGRVLNLLKLKPETTQKELSYLLDMRPQSLGELLGKLEKKGYISREPLESDRRVMVIRLTEAGLIAANTNEKEEKVDIFDVLTQEEQESLHKIFEKLLSSLKNELPEDSRGSFEDRRMGRGTGRGCRGHHPIDRTNSPFGSREKPFNNHEFPFREKYNFGFFDHDTKENDEFNDF